MASNIVDINILLQDRKLQAKTEGRAAQWKSISEILINCNGPMTAVGAAIGNTIEKMGMMINHLWFASNLDETGLVHTFAFQSDIQYIFGRTQDAVEFAKFTHTLAEIVGPTTGYLEERAENVVADYIKRYRSVGGTLLLPFFESLVHLNSANFRLEEHHIERGVLYMTMFHPIAGRLAVQLNFQVFLDDDRALYAEHEKNQAEESTDSEED